MARPPGRRRGLLVGAAAVLVAAVATAYLLLRDDGPELRWQGERIADASATLEQGEGILADLVDERHAVLADDSRCYFSLPADEGVSDVADHLRCGPVLFVDGNADEPWLSFPLSPAPDDEGGDVRLTVGEVPVEPEPAALQAGERLRRPDGRTPPGGAGGLEPPEPPPAPEDHLGAVPLGPSTLGTPPEGAVVGSLNRDYEITGLGPIERYGVGDSARRAADGHQLIAFTVAEHAGEAITPGEAPGVQVQIDGGAPRDVASLIAGADPVVVSAPEGAESVDLVVNDAGIEQRISLLDGTPAAGNLQVLTRRNRSLGLGTAHQVSATGTDAVGSGPVTGTVTVNRVDLEWFLPEDPAKRASRGDSALLVVALTYDWVELVPTDSGLAEGAFTLALPDGRTLQALNLAADPVNEVLIAFEVPASFTTGTLRIGGVVSQGNGLTIDFARNVYSTPIEIPAG